MKFLRVAGKYLEKIFGLRDYKTAGTLGRRYVPAGANERTFPLQKMIKFDLGWVK